MELGLSVRTALVTGASAGIGMAIVNCLASEGVRLAITARRETLLHSIAERLQKAGAPRVTVIPADITDRAQQNAIADEALKALTHVDILVNCAGASRPVTLELDDSVWDDAYALNFTAFRRLTHLLLPGMRSQQWGRIINISSSGEPRSINAGGVAKASLHAWAKGLACVVAKDGITINTIAPGRIWSEQTRGTMNPLEIEREAFIETNIPIGRFGNPEELAVMATFLASPLASYITGTVIPVDGGMRRFTL